MLVTTWSGSNPPDGKAILEHVITVVLKQPKDGPLAKALDREGICEIFDLLLLASLTMMISGMQGMMALRPPAQLVSKECWRFSSCSLHTTWLKVTQLMIGPKSPRRTLMASGPAIHVFLPLKRTTMLCYQLHQLPPDLLSDFKKGIKRCFPIQCPKGSQVMRLMALVHSSTGSSTRCLWCAQLHI